MQSMNGLDMGYHHSERTSATRMVELISRVMHETMIDKLLSKNSPISIILDGSSDSSGRHYMIVYFHNGNGR